MYHLQQPAHTLKRLVANTITLLPPKCHHISALPPFHLPEMAACYLPANGDSIGSLRRKTRFEKGFLYMIRSFNLNQYIHDMKIIKKKSRIIPL